MIHKGHIKLPDDYQLRRHLQQGMTPTHIAERYGCARETVRSRIIKAGLEAMVPPTDFNRPSKTPVPAKLGIDVRAEKIVFTKETTATENGGVARRSMSLPRLSMHVAALRAAGRC